MKKSKQLFENQNLMKLKKLYTKSKSISLLMGCYWVVMRKDMYIEESPTAPQTFNEDIFPLSLIFFLEKTIDTILEAAAREWWGMENICF
jgi:hypothetical protein